MKYNKTMLGVGVFAILLAFGAVATASAYQGDYTKKGPSYSPERHEAMTNAFTNGDYNAWKDLMSGKGRVMQVINADNFSKFAEARKLGEAGDTAGADVIRQELGLRTGNGEKIGAGYGQKNKQGKGMGSRSGNRGNE